MMQCGFRCFIKACLMATFGLTVLISTEAITHAMSMTTDAIKWSVRIYPKNSDYLEVIVDPRRLPTGYVVLGISYEVYFYAEQSRYIGMKSLSFTKDKETISDFSRPYRRYAANPYSSARLVKGGYVYATLTSRGQSFFECPHCSQKARVVDWDQLEKSIGIQSNNPASQKSQALSRTYVNRYNREEYLKLNSNGTFYLREGGRSFVGKYDVVGNVITLNLGKGWKARGRFQKDGSIFDEDRKIWIKN